MSLSTFTYTGAEALEMLKNTFPKTWKIEIEEGQKFIKALMKMYHLSANMAFEKYLRLNGSPANGIATLAALHTLLETSKTSDQIKNLQQTQLDYGNQLAALETAQHISYEDKKILRSFYLTKQDELQKRIDSLILELPVTGAKRIIVQTGLFD